MQKITVKQTNIWNLCFPQKQLPVILLKKQIHHQTTKKESHNPLLSHGFGLSIIEDICRKYDGAYQWLDRTDHFDSIVLLKLL